jgi:hypothetical protein
MGTGSELLMIKDDGPPSIKLTKLLHEPMTFTTDKYHDLQKLLGFKDSTLTTPDLTLEIE